MQKTLCSVLWVFSITKCTHYFCQLHITISGKKIDVSEIPELSLPDDWVRDKLELNFYKSKDGGGEVENVKYDKKSRTAVITFLKPGGIVCNTFVSWMCRLSDLFPFPYVLC